ncbi:MAG: hypothetical protein BM564_02095 [Bacteroidetes bacterium MedPE-SWsnd-G2]|nr:MAG: hypothetical protein BM564_02095 [Bacteroidetes bacterium MedPE-SWsnd-G2]
MYKNWAIVVVILVLLAPSYVMAQIDYNKRPDDDLGNVEDSFQEYFFEALKQKGIENYQRSIDAFEKCIALDDSDPTLYFEIGKNYNKLKNFGAAETALKKAVEKDPENEWFLDELYHVYIQQDDIEKAVKTAKQLVKHHPDYKQDLVSLYIKAEKYNDAIKLLDELDQEFGVNTDRDYLRNQVYNLTGKDKDRIDNLKERISIEPNNENHYLTLIFRYSEIGKKDEAFKTAQQLLKINPDSQLVHLALYKFYLDEDKVDDAVHSMKIVLTSNEIAPNAKSKVLKDFVNFVYQNPEYQNLLVEVTALVDDDKDAKSLLELAQYYLKEGDKEKALSYYEEILKQEPNNFTVLRDCLLLQLDLNKNKEVVKRSEEALELYPAQPILYLVNGVAYNQLENGDAAIEALESGLDYIIEDQKMELDFYTQLSIAYKLINNISKSEAFSKKAEALKPKQ